MRISLAGSGNVATHLGAAFKNAGHSICKVWSRNPQNAAMLAYHLKSSVAESVADSLADANLLVISVSDDAIPMVAGQLRTSIPIVHTSGSTGMEVLADSSPLYGVFYPLQTFSKTKEVDFRQVPVTVEGSSAEVRDLLKSLAATISDKVSEADSGQRLALHVAAVFAGNFSNHLYRLAEKVLESNGVSFDVIRPLIAETAAKAMLMRPGAAQTGPAVRNDQNILKKHLEFLEAEPELAALYNILSQQIINFKA